MLLIPAANPWSDQRREAGAAAEFGAERGGGADSPGAAAAFGVPPRARVIDKDAPHQPCGDREKVRAVLPPDAREIDQPEVRLVDKRRRLERVSLPLACHLPAGQSPQLAVNERHQLLERLLIAAAPRDEQIGDVRRRRSLRGTPAWLAH